MCLRWAAMRYVQYGRWYIVVPRAILYVVTWCDVSPVGLMRTLGLTRLRLPFGMVWPSRESWDSSTPLQVGCVVHASSEFCEGRQRRVEQSEFLVALTRDGNQGDAWSSSHQGSWFLISNRTGIAPGTPCGVANGISCPLTSWL